MSDSPWHENKYCVLCAAGEHQPEVHRKETILAVTTHPTRKGRYLGIQDGATMVILAKFDSEMAAETFLDWIRNRNGKPIEFRSETEDGKTVP